MDSQESCILWISKPKDIGGQLDLAWHDTNQGLV
jgi:hypothetical protein